MNSNVIKSALEKVEVELCQHLDADIYYPTKEEIEDMFEFPVPSKPYTLGMRKEDYKSLIHKLLEEARIRLEDEHTNRICSCGRHIKAGDTYFIRIEAGEMPEAVCDLCVEDR